MSLPGRRKVCRCLLLSTDRFQGLQLAELFNTEDMFLSLPKLNKKLWEGKGVPTVPCEEMLKANVCSGGRKGSFRQFFKGLIICSKQ